VVWLKKRTDEIRAVDDAIHAVVVVWLEREIDYIAQTAKLPLASLWFD